jgi:uncharacterized protein (TIGR02266 family)
MVSAAARSFTAEGSLDKTPLVHLLVHMADRALTGSITFVSRRPKGAETNVVHFHEGAPAKVRIALPIAHLGEVLVDLGLLDEQARRSTLEAAQKAGELHGQVLVRTGVIDREALLTGLRTQAVRKLTHIFGLPSETTFSFVKDTDVLHDWGGPELVAIDPLAQIWRALWARSKEQNVDSMLARLGSAKIKLRETTDVDRFGFGPSKLRVIARIRERPSTLADLVASGVAPERVTKLVVYVLLITRHLARGGSARPVAMRTPTDVAVAKSVAPVVASALEDPVVESTEAPASASEAVGSKPIGEAPPTEPARGSPPPEKAAHVSSPPISSGTRDGRDLREHPRYEVELKVGVESESNFYVGLTETVSEGGLFIATHRLRPVGTTVALSLTLPNCKQPIHGTATVRWIRDYAEHNDSPTGMGVRFENLEPEHLRAIQKFLANRRPIFFDE